MTIIIQHHLAGIVIPLRFYIVDNKRFDIGLRAAYRFRIGNEVVHGLTVGVQLGAKF